MTVIVLKSKDKVTGNLDSGISAGAATCTLESGDGAAFPQPYTGDCSSLGSATVLNDTGALASLAVGDFIRNVTDGSWAFVVTGGTNSITTTRLKGGSDNTWDSADIWRANEFVVTFAAIDADGNDTKYEEALVTNRSTDVLTLTTRGYNSTTAQAFSAADYVQIRPIASHVEELKTLLKELNVIVDTATTTNTTQDTNIGTLQTGSYHYVVSTGSSGAYVAATPAYAAYAAGNIVRFKANHTNPGASTLNVNGLGAIAIKKNDGATALAANDIISGQIVEVVYEATSGFFHMVSPVGTPATITTTHKTVYASGADSSALANPTSITAFDTHTYAISANDIVAGVVYEFECGGTYTWAAGSVVVSVMLGSTTFAAVGPTPTGSGDWYCKGFLVGTAAAGASVAVRAVSTLLVGGDGQCRPDYASANVATNGGLTLQIGAKFGTSDAGNAITMTMARFAKASSSAFT